MNVIDTLCIIPAKGCSTRLPNKNLLPLGGESLIARIVRKAIATGMFSTICVSTESEEIAQAAKLAGAEVPFMRPEALSHDPSTIVDVILHAIEFYESQKKRSFKNVCVLLPTTPFVSVEDIKAAMNQYTASSINALLSVSKTEFPPFNAWVIQSDSEHQQLASCFPESPLRYTKSTECPDTYRSNGAVLIADVKQLKHHKGYRSGAIMPYVMPTIRSLDIDTQTDYEYAIFLHQSKKFENE